MPFRQLSPVRRAVPVSLRASSRGAGAEVFAGYRQFFLRSGTEALSIALMDAKARKGVRNPQAIVPAYGCPDLVAACIHAGVTPRLVDIHADKWGYAADALQQAVGPQTVAIVAVNFLGVGDQSSALRSFARAHDVPVIQDSAQYMPATADFEWIADYVVFSFGRGKPLNLLSGGALLVRHEHAGSVSGRITQGGVRDGLKFGSPYRAAAGAAFNFITLPAIYGLASRLPGFGVGATEYSPLQRCVGVDRLLRSAFVDEFQVYSRQKPYQRNLWRSLIDSLPCAELQELRVEGAQPQDEQRLRYPLLARTRSIRDLAVKALNAEGLGASTMYGSSLDRVTGVPQLVREQGPFPGAAEFAGRLFTLPTHSLVDAAAIAMTCRILSKWLSSSATQAAP